MRFLTLLFCLLTVSPAMAKNFVVGTVDMQKLFKAYPGTAPAQKKFDVLAAQKKKDLAESLKVLKDLQLELTNPKSGLTAAQKKEKTAEFQQQSQDLDDQKNHIQAELANKQQEMAQVILAQIKDIVAKVADSEGVDLVMDSNDVPAVSTQVDLTEDVLKKFANVKGASADSN